MYPLFDIVPDIKPEYGGVPETLYSEEQLDIDAFNDPALKDKLTNGIVPFVDTIVRYWMQLFLLISLLYIDNCLVGI